MQKFEPMRHVTVPADGKYRLVDSSVVDLQDEEFRWATSEAGKTTQIRGIKWKTVGKYIIDDNVDRNFGA